MGCTQSKIENEEAVLRCKNRKNFMKEAVSARNAFAAAHSSYATYLKNTGAALSDFAQGEVQTPQLDPSAAANGAPNHTTVVIQPPFEIPPPPPPPSNFSSAPLQRAASMPEIKMPKSESKPVGTIMEEDEDNEIENEGSLNSSLRRRSSRNSRSASKEVEDEAARPPIPPPPSKPENPPPEAHPMPQPPQNAAWEYFFPTMDSIPGTSLSGAEEVSLNKEEIERKLYDEKPKRVDDVDQELRSDKQEMLESVPPPMPEKVVDPTGPPPPPAVVAAAPGKVLKKVKPGPVSVEVKRTGKNVNLVQIFQELDDHFLKASESAHEVSKKLEATRLHYHSNFADNRGHIDHSARVMRVITWNRSFRGQHFMDDGKDDFNDSEEHETHATVLDKLLAWEKKLYDEVKAGELMKFDYQRKVATLNRLKKKGTNHEALEKAKASVSHLHTRYIVDMQSMDSTVSEINHLRDDLLYPKLTELVDGIAIMWKTMRENHEQQLRIVVALRSLDISQSSKETSEDHYKRTYQLNSVVQGWHSQFEKLVSHQKEYIKALNSWLGLNLIPIESSLKEKVSSPPKVRNPPIRRLILAWQDHLAKLPDELARTAISNFGALVDTIFHLQSEEMQLKQRCAETQKDLARKTKQFKDWHDKYLQRKIPDDFDPERTEGYAPDEIVIEKKFVVEQVEKKLEQEEELYVKHCVQVRQKSLVSLKNHLPELFRALSDFAHECSKMYSELSTIAHNLSSGQSLP